MTKHVDLNSIENYIRNKTYPEKIKGKGQKANFRKSCKYFSIVDGHLTYKEKRRVIFEKNRKQDIIHDVHDGINDNPEAVALSGHLGLSESKKLCCNLRKTFYHKLIVKCFDQNNKMS